MFLTLNRIIFGTWLECIVLSALFLLFDKEGEGRIGIIRLNFMMTPMLVVIKLVDVALGSPLQKSYLRNQSNTSENEEICDLEKGKTEVVKAGLEKVCEQYRLDKYGLLTTKKPLLSESRFLVSVEDRTGYGTI
jgi:hypothetical protein